MVTDAGTAEVINYDILSQSITVEYPDERRMRVHLSEVKEVLPKESKGGKSGRNNRGSNRRGRTQQANASKNRNASPKPETPDEGARS